MSHSATLFPPPPRAIRGREQELRALTARIRRGGATRIALVGGGGSGKSLLACALGHRLKRSFPGGLHWLRVGAWDAATLTEMLSTRMGVLGRDRQKLLKQALHLRGRGLIVLDNHENDAALAHFLDSLRDCPVTWIITARRCLLSGVEIFPVVAPLVTSSQAAFPRVASLTQVLRWNPLALDIADGLVVSKAVRVSALLQWLRSRGVERIRVMAHEDDVPEVRLLLDWAWTRLSRAAQRILAVLAFTEGDDIDEHSLQLLARSRNKRQALAALIAFRLVQQPLLGRYTVHAVIRYAIRRRASFDAHRYFEHYVDLLEREPARLRLEQSHLFAAMDHAHQTSNLTSALRVERLLTQLALTEVG